MKQLEGYILFGDYVSTFYNGKAIEAIKAKKKVCMFDVFKRHINFPLKPIIDYIF